MNNEGLNESSGIGTGLAQVFKPYTPQYDQGEIGMVEYKMNAAKQEAAAKKQAKLDKLTANIKSPLMLPKYRAGYKEIADKVLEYRKLNDEEGMLKALADLDAYGTAAKGIYDLDKSTHATILSQGHDKFDGLDGLNVLYDDKRKVNSANVFDEVNTDYNAVMGLKKKAEPFDYIKNVNAAQNAVNPIQEGRRTFISPAAAKDAAQHFIEKDPEFNKFYQDQFKQLDPALQKQYGDYVSFGVADLSPQLVLDKTSPEPEGQTINNIMGGGDKENANPLTVSFSEQEIPIGVKAKGDEQPTTLKTNVLQLPADGVKIGGGLVSTDMYMIDQQTGETKSLKGQGVPSLNYTQIMALPIATKDVTIKNRDGEYFTIKKGQVVQPKYAAAAKAVNNADIPTENKVMAIAVDEEGNRYYQPAPNVAKTFLTEFSGAKGLTYKGQDLLNSMDDYAKWFADNGINVGGYTPTTTQPMRTQSGNVPVIVPTTGGKKTIGGFGSKK